MDVFEKLRILTDAAKYDVACTSSGSDRRNTENHTVGSTVSCGICHTFAADGRCVSLLKILFTNYCINDCKYCVNRISNDVERAAFTPREVAELTMDFYKRNYIEGLFLSSGIIKSPDYTTELICQAISMLRYEYGFNGYIHAKAIPGTSQALITKLGLMVDRLSVNIELPSETSLKRLAPEKTKEKIFTPMGYIQNQITETKQEMVVYKKAPRFAPAGQSTQMIIGATDDTDFQILRLTESLYKKYKLKRVFYSAYVPVGSSAHLPALKAPPLLREHRLYQADWLLRYYGFEAKELLSETQSGFNPLLDPKCDWALRHLEEFPVEVNKAPYQMLLRVPGIGVTGAKRIVAARRMGTLDFDALKKLGVVLKRAVYFITCKGKYMAGLQFSEKVIYQSLTADPKMTPTLQAAQQLSIFDTMLPTGEDGIKCLTGQI